MKKQEKSSHFYELDRNLDNAKQSNTADINNKHVSDLIDQYGGKTRAGGIENDNRVPKYYKGKNGYEARKVCDNFDLTYHLATATTYILRAYHKHDTPVECITKAIAHLEFELEKIKDS
jgi:ribosome-associated translation inhibitor RaiA